MTLSRTILSMALVTAATLVLAETPQADQAAPTQGRMLLGPGDVLAQRDRVEPTNRILHQRLETLLPRLMREAAIDMWVVINREYAEDPVFFSLVPEPVYAARRTTMLVFFDRGDERGLERLSVNRYPYGQFYDAAWKGGNLEEQWQALAEVIRERKPKVIGVNVSRHWPVADGLSASLRDRLMEVLPDRLRKRVVSAETLVVRWMETRSSAELEVYPHIVSLARGVIAEAFSERVITPGATTTEDVAWYIRQRFADLDLAAWFMPDVNVQRASMDCTAESPFCGDDSSTIRRGDVLHTDVGVCYLRLCTDTQEMGYVLRLGERDVSASLRLALAVGNRWQDILSGNFVAGRTGNQILAATRTAAEAEGIVSSTYSHPLGAFGHAPGPTIGMWDNQGDTPVRGDWPLYPNTGYAIEGNIKAPVEEWGDQMVQIKIEQSAVFDGETVWYLAGRQTEWHLVH